jgi:KaiC/GvpD/RAD55 family RecA-like ATPase
MSTVLRFGIPSLDRLMGVKPGGRSREKPIDDYGFYLSEKGSPASLCLIGPDGTGKSVLSLHLASRYKADNLSGEAIPKVLYVSSDFSHERAARVWENFDLGHPDDRFAPFACQRRNKITAVPPVLLLK